MFVLGRTLQNAVDTQTFLCVVSLCNVHHAHLVSQEGERAGSARLRLIIAIPLFQLSFPVDSSRFCEGLHFQAAYSSQMIIHSDESSILVYKLQL